MRQRIRVFVSIAIIALPATLTAQTFRSADTVIKKMWQVGMEQSQTETLAQVLIDSIGPRLSGSPGFPSAVDWLERTYKALGHSRATRAVRHLARLATGHRAHGDDRAARAEPRGRAARVESADTEERARSKATSSSSPSSPTPPPRSSGSRTVRGKFVLVSAPEIMCRAPQELERYARPATVTKINAAARRGTAARR